MANLSEHDHCSQASKLAWECYGQSQQSKAIPAWIVLNSTDSGGKTKSGIWVVVSCMYKRHDLPPGISRERRKDGSSELVSRDLETGERRLLISYDVEDSEIMELFNAEVDLSSDVVTMKHAVAVDELQPEDFMLEHDNFDLTKAWHFNRSPQQNRLSIFGHR